MRVTLSELRTRARQRANEERGNAVAEDAEVDHYLNLGLAALTSQLFGTLEFRPEETVEIVLEAGEEWYTLPEHVSIISVHSAASGTLTKLMRAPAFSANEPDQALVSRAPTYDIRRSMYAQDRIRFPGATSGTFTVRYVTPATKLCTDGACIYDRNYWSEYVVLFAAVQMLRKADRPVELLMAAMEAELGRILNETQRLDMNSSPAPDMTVGPLINRRNYY